MSRLKRDTPLQVDLMAFFSSSILFQTKKNFSIVCSFVRVLLLLIPIQAFSEQNLSFRVALISTLKFDQQAQAYYKKTNFTPIWIDSTLESAARRAALLRALKDANVHALPEGVYQLTEIINSLRTSYSYHDFGLLEGLMTKSFLRYAKDIQSGVLTPSEIDEALAQKVVYQSVEGYLSGLVSSDPHFFMRSLPPQSQEYNNLLNARQRLLLTIKRGGWGEIVPEGILKIGDKGPSIIALRKRLVAKGYLSRSVSAVFDKTLLAALMNFQRDHGLFADGVVGNVTITELNKSAEERLKAITVALERERWHTSASLFGQNLSSRKIVVNLTDFTAKILDEGVVTFHTRSIVGAITDSQKTPEFSGLMQYMVINPTWFVPRSIAIKEFLPELQEDPTNHDYLTLFTPDNGAIVPRDLIDFTLFDETSFPYEMKQLPSQSNALGLVKFMFPNKHNIYLHDTPQKTLFYEEQRTFSHGCIRLQDPFEFAYALLKKQSFDPVAEFQNTLREGKEKVVSLREHVPVHIIYRTAVSSPNGSVGFRRDIYGRDNVIYTALMEAGVALSTNQR